MTSSHNFDRRDFVKMVLAILGTVMAAVIGLLGIGYLISPATKVKRSDEWVPLGTMDSYKLGEPTLFNFTWSTVNGWEKTINSYGVYVTRFDEEQCKVYSNICPHLSCRVSWNTDTREYVCPCHDAHFGISGEVTGGPPPTPLLVYETKIENGNLFIHLLEG